ncbi:MAG: hypothetical protein ACTIKA_00685 [Psychroflexus halocasei]|uniref:hypothetical protein n=1 Tax=Psychroflexus sp. S27 TaxID=1982757 RepID=UPI0012903F1E|nr:hypothetical protein [Psychroflexus sp. S27]
MYNTSNSGDLNPGYYYWQDTKWQRLMPQGDIYSNVKYDGTNFFYINDSGNEVQIDLEELVQDIETNTFIRKVEAVVDADGKVTSPTVYYYFSEEAIRNWLAADAANTDPSTMPNTDPGVVEIEIASDIAENFEFILNKTITYEGEQKTVEEIIKMISSEVEGNVIYTEVGGEMVFQYYNGTEYITIDLGDFVVKNQLTYEVKGGDDVNVANVIDENHTTYTVEVKAAMPKFFYMPTILFDTSTIQNGLTVNLHQEYIDQFTAANIKKNPNAPATIPHLPSENDLHYYVTDFDDNVIDIVEITDTGMLTYNVINNSGPYSYVTVVFVVK